MAEQGRDVRRRLLGHEVLGGRVVPLGVLIEDLWEAPPAGAAGAIRTFVGALRRAIEPGRPPRTGFQILVTQGPGYALQAGPDDLDALRFERLAAEADSAAAPRVLELSEESSALWRGPAYAEFADEPWTEAERARLAELRLALTERQAEARLALGHAAQAVADLRAHLSGHPWREDAWRLLALALYRGGRQAEALDVIRRARSLLATELGLDPGPSLAALETDILRQAAHLEAPAGDVLAVTAAAYQRTAPGFTRTRLESAAALAGGLALVGGSGLQAAMSQRLAAIEAAEKLGDPELTARVVGDPELTARVVGNFDVPAIWTRSDDPVAAARIVAAAERALALLPAGRDSLRARLLATIALESRGSPGNRPGQAAAEAEAIARHLGDPALLVFTLNGVWMQSFRRTGLAAQRDAIGGEIVTLAT
ncbi:MAG TPA: BTAD domain-containing putative transcriptional regulator, partial [Trebonia sp.]